MADGGYRGFPQSGAAPYYQSHNYQPQHPQRHTARNGSPVNSGRGNYANETPSPSRSPVSQASSHHPYTMYGQGHQQGQHVMMNGHHQRYMQSSMSNKYQHQTYQQQQQQQQHGQQNHHHQQTHTGGHHQQTFSSGALSNATPHFTPNNLHNGNSNNNQMGSNENFAQNPHWTRQMALYAESRNSHQAPHHHCKKDGMISRVQKAMDQVPAEELPEQGAEERNRATTVAENSRQDWNALDFSGQGMKSLSPMLFQYEFLHKLYLDHNKLTRLDPFIGQLRHLSHLDISFNQIMELPEEIGMLVNLQELLVFDNGLQTLPYTIGNLFRLEMLGVEGNPLEEQIKEHIMLHGTNSLITMIRENDQTLLPPNDRRKVELDKSPASETLSVISYNILCDKYATKVQYGYAPSDALAWDKRKLLILDELKHHDADILCLQEVDRDSFDGYFRRELALLDYRGVFWPKSRAKTMAEKEARLVDGCATFYKGSKYICLDKMLIDFANAAINRPDMKGEHDTFNRVMPKDNIAVATFLENRMTGSRMIVVNAHITWDPEFADVKLVQVAILMEQITKQADQWARHPPCTDKRAFPHSKIDDEEDEEEAEEIAIEPGPSLEYSNGPQIPLIICGDFNSAAGTGVYDLITTGSLPGNHIDLGNRRYGNFTRDGMAHPFKLKSAYNTPEELSFTNYTPNFSGIIDYIWYSTNSLVVRELLGNVDEDYLRKVPGFPNRHFPSDHMALKAEFAVKPRKDSKAIEANGNQREWERSS